MSIYLSELVITDDIVFDYAPLDGITWVTETTNTVANIGYGYVMNTITGPLTLTLPLNPMEGDKIGLKDYANTFDVNSVTIISNGNPIHGINSNYVISLKGWGGSFVYTDPTRGWVIYSDYQETYLPLIGGTLSGNLSAPSFTEDGVLLENKYSDINHNHDTDYEPINSNIQAHISDITGNPHQIDKSDVGLSNVPNIDATNASNITSGTLDDARIPSTITRDNEVNTATQSALDLKSDTTHLHTGIYEPYNVNIQSHIGDTSSNPHNVTSSQIGLSNVDNTSDIDKPVSTLQQSALDNKLSIVDIHNSPVDGIVTSPISSNWAYDHIMDSDAHGQYLPLAGGTLDDGQYTVLNIRSDDNGRSSLFLYGSLQGSGVLHVGQSTTWGGGIGYDGDGIPSPWTDCANDFIYLFRATYTGRYWTARNYVESDDWEFRGDISTNHNIHANVFLENGSSLVDKYLGITAKAADSDLFDGLNSSYFATSAQVTTILDTLDTSKSGLWVISSYSQDMTTYEWYHDIIHNLNIDAPIVVCWDTSTNRIIQNIEIEQINLNTIRIIVENNNTPNPPSLQLKVRISSGGALRYP